MVKKIRNYIIKIMILGVFIVCVQNKIISVVTKNEFNNLEITSELYRSDFFSEEQRKNKHLYSGMCKTFLDDVEKDVSYYPVAESSVDKLLTTSFVNTWMSERTYGGKRGHEGIDIMASKDKRGIYPIVSMTDGIITNLGWLEKGGYRVGITSDSGIYYYYAHLDSYSNIKKGQRIKAGEILGFMGDSGYGSEGTVGKFAVHLHVGIYLYIDGKEVSVNPYYILCYLENKKLKYAYS